MGAHAIPRDVIDAPAPCDECQMRARCAADRLACVAFAVYQAGADERTWTTAPREPSAEIFATIFHSRRGPPKVAARSAQAWSELIRERLAMKKAAEAVVVAG